MADPFDIISREKSWSGQGSGQHERNASAFFAIAPVLRVTAQHRPQHPFFQRRVLCGSGYALIDQHPIAVVPDKWMRACLAGVILDAVSKPLAHLCRATAELPSQEPKRVVAKAERSAPRFVGVLTFR